MGDAEHPEPVELAELRVDEAHLLEGLLKEAGIEVDVLDSDNPYSTPVGAPSRVFVNQDQLEQAREIYKQFDERQRSAE
ncbi:MAG: putative signal transducing protein [Actinomycetota bacterium]|jgi:hypothetical protein